MKYWVNMYLMNCQIIYTSLKVDRNKFISEYFSNDFIDFEIRKIRRLRSGRIPKTNLLHYYFKFPVGNYVGRCGKIDHFESSLDGWRGYIDEQKFITSYIEKHIFLMRHVEVCASRIVGKSLRLNYSSINGISFEGFLLEKIGSYGLGFVAQSQSAELVASRHE